MVSFRPSSSAHYLERPRLLELLPDEAGFAVWLEAPYGYGKSVLASQWAAQLEAKAWRVVWVSLAGRALQGGLTAALALPAEAPWEVLLELLWCEPTLVVVEDVERGQALSPLLAHLGGLVLIASRGALISPELPRLATQGRLIHLHARQLAFTEEETAQLAQDEARARELWNRTQGWPLPVHFGVLTGEVLERRTLLAGIRESVSDETWDELLLLGALRYLPSSVAREATARLAETGFAQRLESGFKLHPLVAEALQQSHLDELRAAVRAQQQRLPPLLRGEAFENADLFEELSALLEDDRVEFAKADPAAVLRWDKLAPPRRHGTRLRHVGWARFATGDSEGGVEALLEATSISEQEPNARLSCYREAVWCLAQLGRFAEATRLAEEAEVLFAQADGDRVGAFLNNLHLVHFERGAWEEAQRTLERALEAYPPTSSNRTITAGNLSIVKWHRYGDLEALREGRGEALACNRRHNPSNVPGDLLQLAEVANFMGDRATALEHAREVKQWAHAAPRWALEAEALRAYLEGDASAFVHLARMASHWQEAPLDERIRFFWAKHLLERGDRAGALGVLEGRDGPYSRIARALALEGARRSEALAALGAPPSETSFMEERLYWHAARYLLTRADEDLEALLTLTRVRERILPGLVPLAALPRHRPELAAPYPLAEVLRSGWKAAVERRLDEIPPLELTLLGRVEARLMGQKLALSSRQKELLVLLALKQRREAIAEMLWPEASPQSARNNLNVQLNLLRKQLEPWGVTTYLVEAGLIRATSDLYALEEALVAKDVEKMLRLYRGDFAPGVDLPLVDDVRFGLRQRVADTLYHCALELEGLLAEDCVKRVLTLDPLHEPALQRYLALLIGRGRRSEALQRYQAFAARLAEETGLEPLPETQGLVAR